MRFSLPTVVLAASLLSDSSLVAAWPVASDITGLSLQKAHNALFRRGNSVTGGPANRGNNQQSGRNGRNSNGDSGSDDDVEMLEGSDESGDTELEYKTDGRKQLSLQLQKAADNTEGSSVDTTAWESKKFRTNSLYKVAAESDNNDCNFDPKIKNTRDYLNKPFADLNTDERNAGRPDILKTTGYRYLDIEPAQRDPAWGITADNDDDNPLSQTFHSPGTGIMVISEMRAWPDKNAKAGGDNNVLPTSELLFQGYEDAAQRSGVSVKGLRFVANRQVDNDDTKMDMLGLDEHFNNPGDMTHFVLDRASNDNFIKNAFNRFSDSDNGKIVSWMLADHASAFGGKQVGKIHVWANFDANPSAPQKNTIIFELADGLPIPDPNSIALSQPLNQ